ncbi:Sodium channel protein type 4 subunit alpha B [Intoshia linei]|uniref:Sodium channel protein n=1 Tax=Intoshia linei TaxID=1819745 RepID=A0A177B2L2_9BILA|nr:Sodium channel protein type 4 subunit alpha B [Intoshia linei]
MPETEKSHDQIRRRRTSMAEIVSEVVDLRRATLINIEQKEDISRKNSILGESFGDISYTKIPDNKKKNQFANQMYTEFTMEKLDEMRERIEAEKKRKEEGKNMYQEAKLVDGELKFDNQEEDDKPERMIALVEGNVLPDCYVEIFPKKLLGKPISEIDPYLSELSFVVISKRFKKFYINRYSASKALFLLSPWTPIRRVALRIATHQLFDYFIILTIITNCIFLTLKENAASVYAEYLFLGIYTLEAIVKISARGLFLNSYTYFRDPWNWLDFIVIASSYIVIVFEVIGNQKSLGNITGLRTFRVLRAFKTFSIVPGLKTIIGALLKSLRWVFEVITLTMFIMMVYSLFTLQVYNGVLRNKCILNKDVFSSDMDWMLHKKIKANWYGSEGDYLLCGNVTGAGKCPQNYTCLPDIGENPNYGYTNFDSFGWAMLNIFQLVTLDFWEDLYDKVIRANGYWNVVFFAIAVFCSSYYLINLMLAVVAIAYEEEVQADARLQELINLPLQDSNLNSSMNVMGKSEIDVNRTYKHDKTSVNDNEDNVFINKKSKSKRNSKNIINEISKENPRKSIEISLNVMDIPSTKAKKSIPKTENILKRMMDSSSQTIVTTIPTVTKENFISINDAAEPSNSIKQQSEQSCVSNEVSDNNSNQAFSINESLNAQVNLHFIQTWFQYISGFNIVQYIEKREISTCVILVDSEFSTIISVDTYRDRDEFDIPDYIVEDLQDEEAEKMVDRNCAVCSINKKKSYKRWLQFQNTLYNVVGDFIFEMVITFCIALNVLVMAMEYHDMNASFKYSLKIANIVFTSIFIIEAIFKLLALSKQYFSSKWNIFDFIIVLASIIDLGVDSVDGLSVLRAFRLLRLLRVFKLAQTWNTMRVLLYIIINTLGALGNITVVLLIVIYIFAVIGMQLFNGSYEPHFYIDKSKPAWHFDDFPHSLLLIFRILCGEWIEPLWDCMRPNGQLCILVIVPTLVIGNFMVLNLFLALLLSSFASDSLHHTNESTDEDSHMIRGIKKIKNLFKKSSIVKKNKPLTLMIDHLANQRHITILNQQNKFVDSGNSGKMNIIQKKALTSAIKKISKLENSDTTNSDIAENRQLGKTSLALSSNRPSLPVKELDEEVEDEAKQEMTNCLPNLKIFEKLNIKFDSTNFSKNWKRMRMYSFRITEHKSFEYFILAIIFASSISLCFEDIYIDDNPILKTALSNLDIIFTIIFMMEMVFKWISLGFYRYFTSFWSLLDFFIVVISLITLATQSDSDQISSLRALRTFRAFRPLRAVSRWQGMRIVVNALMVSIPSIANVMLVCSLFWLIFSIAGVQLFGGKFYKCLDSAGELLNANLIKNKTMCLNMGYRWQNSKVNFDNAIGGYLALFQVATFEGWMEIIQDATRVNDVDKQPFHESNFHANWFFMLFIIIGSFFTLNLLVGVIIDNFNCQKKKYDGNYLDVFLTPNQRGYYNTLKRLTSKRPIKNIKRPKGQLQNLFYDISISIKFELVIVILIVINTIIMTIEHYRQRITYSVVIEIANVLFTTTFLMEAIVKIIGMRWHYFRQGWNIFDFIIVITSILSVIFEEAVRNIFITPTLLRVVRVFRIGRALRLIKWAKGIRKLMFALIISFPALVNIGMLLLLIIFIYSIFGMSLFGHVKNTFGMNDLVNFQTFPSSFLVLLRLTTAAGWNEILDPLMISEPDCDPNFWTNPQGVKVKGPNGDCGNYYIAIAFMVSFIFVTYLIIINMYIAVILENFTIAHEQEEVGITEDDFDSYYSSWKIFDPYATQFIKFEDLYDFVDTVDPPLGIRKPNEISLVALDIPIVIGDKIHCLDILIALCKHVLGNIEQSKELIQLKDALDAHYTKVFPIREGQIVISSTMKRKKEDVAAKTLQRAYRKHRNANISSNLKAITQMAIKSKDLSSSGTHGGTISNESISARTTPMLDKNQKHL